MKNLLLSMLMLNSCHYFHQSDRNSDWVSTLDIKNHTIIDVRTPQEVKQNPAHGSINIPLHELEQTLAQLDPNKKVLIFCEIGGRASKAKKILTQKGFTNVVNIGSWRDWNKAMSDKKSSQ